MDGQINCGPAGRPLPLQKNKKYKKYKKLPQIPISSPIRGKKSVGAGLKPAPHNPRRLINFY